MDNMQVQRGFEGWEDCLSILKPKATAVVDPAVDPAGASSSRGAGRRTAKGAAQAAKAKGAAAISTVTTQKRKLEQDVSVSMVVWLSVSV